MSAMENDENGEKPKLTMFLNSTNACQRLMIYPSKSIFAVLTLNKLVTSISPFKKGIKISDGCLSKLLIAATTIIRSWIFWDNLYCHKHNKTNIINIYIHSWQIKKSTVTIWCYMASVPPFSNGKKRKVESKISHKWMLFLVHLSR